MRTFLLSLGIAPAALLALCATLLAADLDLSMVRDQILVPTVQINGNCSGTIVSSKRDDKTGDVATYVLTAKHCVADHKDDPRNIVQMPSADETDAVVKQDVIYAAVVSMSYRRDLAIMRLADKERIYPTATVAGAVAHKTTLIGEPVLVVGYPGGLGRYLVEGRYGGRETLPFNFPGRDMAEYVRATAPTMGGNSGGGLYRLRGAQYELFGVMVVGLRENPQMGFYVPIEEINRFLTSVDAVAFPGAAAPAATGAVIGPKSDTTRKVYQ